MKKRTRTYKYYQLVTDTIGGELPNGYSSNTFNTKKEVREHWETEYRDRKKNDGNDAYWNKVPFMYVYTTETVDFYS